MAMEDYISEVKVTMVIRHCLEVHLCRMVENTKVPSTIKWH